MTVFSYRLLTLGLLENQGLLPSIGKTSGYLFLSILDLLHLRTVESVILLLLFNLYSLSYKHYLTHQKGFAISSPKIGR